MTLPPALNVWLPCCHVKLSIICALRSIRLLWSETNVPPYPAACPPPMLVTYSDGRRSCPLRGRPSYEACMRSTLNEFAPVTDCSSLTSDDDRSPRFSAR